MGFFSVLFGGTEYSTTPHPLSTDAMQHLFWKIDHPNLSVHLKQLVEAEVLKGRSDAGQISLAHIRTILIGLEHRHLLTEFNRRDFFTIFKNYFETHFKS